MTYAGPLTTEHRAVGQVRELMVALNFVSADQPEIAERAFAWAAGVPAILGPEPAFRELRRSELDYIEVRTPADVLAALRRLREFPGAYGAMIENGQRRAAEFATAAILDRWLDVLNGPVSQHFLQWQAKSALERAAFIVPSLVRDRLAKRAYVRAIRAGARILDVDD